MHQTINLTRTNSSDLTTLPPSDNTARPLNLNLSDLSRTDWRTPPPAPLHVYTDASFQLVQCKIAEQIRRALDELVLSGKRFSYEAVLQQDAVRLVSLLRNYWPD